MTKKFRQEAKQTAEIRQHSTKALKSGTVNLLQSRHLTAQFCPGFQTIRARSSANWDSNEVDRKKPAYYTGQQVQREKSQR
jgi:hypothetical protein